MENRRRDAGATGAGGCGACDEAIHFDRFAVGEDVDGAVGVGAECPDAGGFESIESFGARVSVGVSFSRRDDCDLRIYGREKIGRGGIFAAVVADFQDVGVDGGFVVFGKQGALDGFFGVAGEE